MILKKLCNIFGFLAVLLIFLTVFVGNAVFALSENWVEVTTFTEHDGDGLTNQFTCNHVDWRIKWRYKPSSNSHATVFTIDILSHHDNTTKTLYTVGDNGLKQPTPAVFGQLNQTGTCYVTNQNGTFSLNTFSFAPSYTIIIEENLESIPEFSSFTLLSLVLTGTLVALIYKTKTNLPNSGA